MRVSALAVVAPALILSLTAAAPPSTGKDEPVGFFEALGMKPPGLRGAELEAAVRAANVFPLGSDRNPVRTKGIEGQRDYLSRLRCSDGRAPKVLGRGPGMPSPFGGIIDIYSLRCEGGEPETAAVRMDMYHEHVETRAAPGFTIVAPSAD